MISGLHHVPRSAIFGLVLLEGTVIFLLLTILDIVLYSCD